MKIRSVPELETAVTTDLARRKRSVTTLRFIFGSARSHQREPVGLAVACMLYAHWEGFVKFAGRCFTNYVNSLRLPYENLSNGLVATCLRSQIKGLRTSNKVSLNRDLVELLRDRVTEVPRIPWQSAIDTYDNLNSEVLEEILTIMGCSAAPYATKKALIDERLLGHRNRIAHTGHDHDFDVDDVPDLCTEVVALLDQVAADVQNAAVQGLFKK